MKVGISGQIDVTKIDKAKLYQGKKGTYLDIKTFVDLDQIDQYKNNGMITQELDKESREAGERGAILGNVKVFWRDDKSQPAPAQPSGDDETFDDDIPF